ncbi:hypothetical protein PV396_32765 [Streptomyces sp. ME02-8801-2C]|uniref:hypothetical protein n=1 Tax=Streptomyces sp. ME02-8801-2C TaxID=3028680 RepID=UPI0029BF806F|nr:hypothetical protein [Streptomyces sp. ME02-8801-2C]MDX3456668.1 hypothetical protein [Streptomyces sp. ME02-8801-2C]
MNTATDNIVGILVVVAIFVALALPSLIGLARDRRIDQQIRAAERARREAERIGPTELPARRRLYFTTTVTHHS